MEVEPRHPIKVLAHRTGLSPHVIRMWEKRYGAVSPLRTATNRRLYSEADVERLLLLRRAILAGRSIGQIAHLPTERLSALVMADETAVAPPRQRVRVGVEEPIAQTHLHTCLTAVEHLDADALEAALLRAATALSGPSLIEHVLVPLLHQIGDLWREGVLRVAHEHVATVVIRTFVEGMRRASAPPNSAPHLIATTPTGQLHELGALLVAATAAAEGWRALYLGASLPAEEIAAAAVQYHAQVVALSLVYPPDDPHLGQELQKLRRCLPDDVVLLVGGRAADGYGQVLDAIGALRRYDMLELRTTLESLRSRHLSA